MTKERKLWIAGLCLAVVGSFGAGYEVGTVPLRVWQSMSGGAAGDFARQLQAAANDFSDPAGQPHDAAAIVRGRVAMADLMSVDAALSFCAMPVAYRSIAQRASARLEHSAAIAASHDDLARHARQYMLHASAGAACVPFKDAAPGSLAAR